MASQISSLTQEEEATLIGLLDKVGSIMSAELFIAFAAKLALTAIETVILRRHTDGVQVLLTQRPADDATPALRNLWHSPGTMLRASDETVNDAFKRVENSEISARFKYPPVLADVIYHHYERGAEVGLVYFCELEGEPKVGKFVWTDELPDDLVPHHHDIIRVAVRRFLRR